MGTFQKFWRWGTETLTQIPCNMAVIHTNQCCDMAVIHTN